jgi:hypothetical protein
MTGGGHFSDFASAFDFSLGRHSKTHPTTQRHGRFTFNIGSIWTRPARHDTAAAPPSSPINSLRLMENSRAFEDSCQATTRAAGIKAVSG